MSLVNVDKYRLNVELIQNAGFTKSRDYEHLRSDRNRNHLSHLCQKQTESVKYPKKFLCVTGPRSVTGF